MQNATWAAIPGSAVLGTTAKPYRSMVQHNANSWQAVQACLASNGGTATKAQLMAALAAVNNPGMVAYLYRNGHLAPVPAPAKPATAAKPTK